LKIVTSDKEIKILNIGCGKSLLAEEMYEAGYKHILSVDYSEQVIKEMNEKS